MAESADFSAPNWPLPMSPFPPPSSSSRKGINNMRAAFLVLTAMGTLATTYGGKATLYVTADCSGPKVITQDFVSGVCLPRQVNGVNAGSALITCTGTSFSARLWFLSQECG